MATSDEPSAADQRRVMEFLLACFDNDAAAAEQVEAAIAGAPDGWRGAFAVLAAQHVSAMCQFVGEQRARDVLAVAVLDAGLHEGGE